MPEQRRLKAALIELGVTQLEASKILGISREAFNRKLNGRIRFSLEEAFKMSEFIDEPIEDIFLLNEFTESERTIEKGR